MDSATTYSDPALLAYSDARSEYTRQLCQYIVPATFQFFMKLLDKARQEVGRDTHKTLFQFQTYLKEIPDWNMEKVTNEIRQLEVAIGCEYLEDLLTAVFIAHTKILTAIRVSSKKTANVQISVPKVERFLFKVICEMSGLYWKNTYLFRDDVKNLDKQQNYRQAEAMISEGISMAIRSLVPVKNILRECVVMDERNHVEADTDSDGEEAASALPASTLPASVPAASALPASVPAVSALPEDTSADANADTSSHPVVKALLEPISEVVASAYATAAEADSRPSTSLPDPPATNVGADAAVAESEALLGDQQAIADADTPIINIDDNVSFAEYDTVFGSEESNMIFDPKTQDLPTSGLIEISSEPPMDLDIADIEDDSAPASSLTADDFEELVA